MSETSSVSIYNIIRSAHTFTSGTAHTSQSVYGREIAKSCFNNFFAKQRGVFVSASSHFDWMEYSGTFENQIAKEYSGEGITVSGAPFYLEVPQPNSNDNIIVANILNYSAKTNSINFPFGYGLTQAISFGETIGDYVVSRYFSPSASPFKPVFQFTEEGTSYDEIKSMLSAALLTCGSIEEQINHGPSYGSNGSTNFSAYTGYNINKTITGTALNDYIRSAASFVYRTYLGKNYLWHGSAYSITNYLYSAVQESYIHYQYSGINTEYRNAFASGWVGDIRKQFHSAMTYYINMSDN